MQNPRELSLLVLPYQTPILSIRLANAPSVAKRYASKTGRLPGTLGIATQHSSPTSIVMACRQKPLFDAGPSDQLFYDGSLQLPPELMLVVVDYLRLHDTLSLSLTCKAFYILFFPKYRRLNASTAECFLSVLERDQPSLHYCHICVKLHTWRNQYPGKGPLLLPRSSTSPDCLFGPGPRVQGFAYGRDKIGHIRRGLKLRFHDARLVMNAHLYGAAHGLPIDALDYASPLPHHSEYVRPCLSPCFETAGRCCVRDF